ncbi:DHH family phosphoesterase [Mycoplasmoides pneumoniae]|uniref:DHH family phosphoesterase n=1 Tax=Mycoplasmoides pneumoniae TaxID=2104 RepID=UPI00137632A7|nr:bifunctional oligoribonuclease/PAP phosphatase NrnA [Mycoplasmoides pneumoniae]QHR16000.1 bifunctional oligoribonuclease/PAP phosphatase NrnA [Mycoplasmoides pneumoniae]
MINIDPHFIHNLTNKLKTFDNFSLYVHVNPDFDAFGAAFAFKAFLAVYFPHKKAYVMGSHNIKADGKDLFPFEAAPIDDAFVKNSLAIIFDTSNQERVLTQKHKLAKETVRIDHHPKTESFADLEWIDPAFSAAAEMVGYLILQMGYELNAEMAAYIYAGIITDTQRFSSSATTPQTFALTAKLLETGFNRNKVHDAVYLKPLLEHKYFSYVLNKAKITPNGLAYALLKKGTYKQFGVASPLPMVHALNNIKGVKIWTTCYFNEDIKKWIGSIRSRSIPINNFAQMFGGGGHKYAAAFVLDDKRQFMKLVEIMDDFLAKQKHVNS